MHFKHVQNRCVFQKELYFGEKFAYLQTILYHGNEIYEIQEFELRIKEQ